LFVLSDGPASGLCSVDLSLAASCVAYAMSVLQYCFENVCCLVLRIFGFLEAG
jgi:hypothetical protein